MNGEPRYGSDLVVDLLTHFGVRYAALNPGASIRGIHESLTNAGTPEIVLALHEEIAVAIAHGYAKAANAPMAVLLHDLVGLQHASMAIFNAWIDQVPILLLGGSGPADARRRRPWIDWIHTTRWQSLAVREVVKWDDEPVSTGALVDSLTRAYRIATTSPTGPTYVAIDALLQEQPVGTWDEDLPDRPRQHMLTALDPDLDEVAEALRSADNPVLMADLVGRSRPGYEALIQLADATGAPVIDLGARHNFPNTHWADLSDDRAGVLSDADLVACFDVRDVVWATSEIDLATHGSRPLIAPTCRILNIGLDDLLHRGFNDSQGATNAAPSLTADTSAAIPAIVDRLQAAPPRGRDARIESLRRRSDLLRQGLIQRATEERDRAPIAYSRVAGALWEAVRDYEWIVANGTASGWARRLWSWDRFGCYLGHSGGAGLGYGIGASIGAALAQESSDTIVVDLQADGDLLYTPSALWTAAHLRLPLLTVVLNNRTYGKDRIHQATLAETRSRGRDLIHIGIDIDDPPISFSQLAESQGVEGIGPVTSPDELPNVFQRAVSGVLEGRPVLVDVIVDRA